MARIKGFRNYNAKRPKKKGNNSEGNAELSPIISAIG
jgi:hypothetical protein